MKNHKIIGGRLLQTNKKWSQLKQSQQDWISRITYEEHAAYVEANGKLPMKKNKQAVIDKVMDRIRERSIWMPHHEAEPHISNYIDRANRKSPLFRHRDSPPKEPRE